MGKKFGIVLVVLLVAMVFMIKGYNASAGREIYEGAWLGTWASSSNDAAGEFSDMIGRKTEVVQTFVSTSQSYSSWKGTMEYVDSKGAINLITIEPKKKNGRDYNTVEINKGRLDRYFNNLAKELKDFKGGKEVWVRFMHEVNGNWYGWGIGDSSVNTNQTYISAYRRVVDIFRKNGADNVKFIYNINNKNVGKNATFMGAYPGNSYVDFVSVDGYNWGDTRSYSKWQTFDEVFADAYSALVSGTSKDVMIAEYASAESGGDKAAWIEDAVNQMKSDKYSEIIAAIWFNDDKETDWRVESSNESLKAYRENSF